MQTSTDPDVDAIARIVRGEATGLEMLYDRHSVAVYSLALRIVRDVGEAEDVTQEVFAQAWAQAARFDLNRGTVAAWVLMMARSRALDHLRRKRVSFKPGPGDDVLDGIADLQLSIELKAAHEQEAAAARRALEALPTQERLAIELAYYEGLTQSEIAERTATPLGTVKTRIRAALRRVRELMAPGAKGAGA